MSDKDFLFASDIDNTLIYSVKHPHEGFECVERIHEKEQAFMSPMTVERLWGVCRRVRFVVVTSRSIEQFLRLRFPEGCESVAAVTANGADLLIDGVPDDAWRSETRTLIEPWQEELKRMYELLSPMDCFLRCRVVDDAYLFVYCGKDTDPEETRGRIAERTELNVIASGKKIYLLPPPLNKGLAVRRLRRRFSGCFVIGAGDSEMDIPMLEGADAAIYPAALPGLEPFIPAAPGLYSEFVLETVLKLTEEQ